MRALPFLLLFAFLPQALARVKALEQMDPEIFKVNEEIRRTEDVGRLCQALDSPDRPKLVPGILVMKELRHAPKGFISVGEIILLDPKDLATPVGTRAFQVHWTMETFVRDREEDRLFSPYWKKGFSSKALFANLPATPTTIEEFPETFLVPESWFADALAVSEATALTGSKSGLAGALLGTAALRESSEFETAAELLREADPDLQAYLISLLYEKEGSAETLQQHIKSAKTAPQIRALAVALAVTMFRHTEQEVGVLNWLDGAHAVVMFTQKHPKKLAEYRMFLKWIRNGTHNFFNDRAHGRS